MTKEDATKIRILSYNIIHGINMEQHICRKVIGRYKYIIKAIYDNKHGLSYIVERLSKTDKSILIYVDIANGELQHTLILPGKVLEYIAEYNRLVWNYIDLGERAFIV